MKIPEMLGPFQRVISTLEQDCMISLPGLGTSRTDAFDFRVGAPACGDVMKLQIRVDNDGRITEAKFKTFGCGSAIASSSFMTERVKGLTLDQAAAIKNTDVAKELCLPPVKRNLYCAM